MRLHHATNQQNAEGIKRTRAFHCGQRGFAGGGIYFSQGENGALRKAKCSGSPSVIITCEVNLGRVLHAEKDSVDRSDVVRGGYHSVKINGHDVYAVYDPSRVTILSFKDIYSGSITVLPNQQPSYTPATYAFGGYPPPPFPGTRDYGYPAPDVFEQQHSGSITALPNQQPSYTAATYAFGGHLPPPFPGTRDYGYPAPDVFEQQQQQQQQEREREQGRRRAEQEERDRQRQREQRQLEELASMRRQRMQQNSSPPLCTIC